MAQRALKLRFWGVRGSIPTPSPENMRYGGNTSCLSVSLGQNEHVILDCGTGMRLLGNSLTAGKTPAPPMSFHIFLSHYHFDHIEGLPFFGPLYSSASAITFYGPRFENKPVKDVLESFISPPYFPAPLVNAPARRTYLDADGSPVVLGDVRICTLPLNHPNGSLSYRLERGNRRIVYATDHEHGDFAKDEGLTRFAEGADYLIYDATYVPSEYEMLRRGWGHSTWFAGVSMARAARVKTLILFHHHPAHTDEQLEAVLATARQELPSVEIAREGMELDL